MMPRKQVLREDDTSPPTVDVIKGMYVLYITLMLSHSDRPRWISCVGGSMFIL